LPDGRITGHRCEERDRRFLPYRDSAAFHVNIVLAAKIAHANSNAPARGTLKRAMREVLEVLGTDPYDEGSYGAAAWAYNGSEDERPVDRLMLAMAEVLRQASS
jgi:hypothetical protein